MSSQMILNSPVTSPTLKRHSDLLLQARRLGIQSAERSKLEAMCAHAGLRYDGLSDAALRRALQTVLS